MNCDNELSRDERQRMRNEARIQACRMTTAHCRTKTGACACGRVVYDAHLKGRVKANELEVTTKDAEWLAWWRNAEDEQEQQK